ncbi:MAG: response regulator transcription factor [Anaerolineae bacterium]|nr:response regulator transcription factor [Anaerolineae bacterium]
MLVDDHEMVRRGLATYLKITPDLLLVGEATDGSTALAICQSTKPDVVIMDLVMPKVSGIEAIRQIRASMPAVQIIALTSFQERDLVQQALQEGAISYLLKNVTGEELTAAIRAAYHGRPTLAPEIAHDLIRSANHRQPGEDLTKREREVLALMVEGLTNPEIATRLSVSLSTARAHVSNILSKLNVSNRSEAVALALRLKLVR